MISPRSLFNLGILLKYLAAGSADFLAQLIVAKILKYTKYFCGFQPRFAPKSLAAHSAIYFCENT